jgi:hypothetical protein
MITEQSFNRYSIATIDFMKAAEFATEAQQHSPASLIYEALVFAAVVCYHRPFSSNEKNKNANAASSLTIEEFSSLTQEEMSIHTLSKELRNQALAHSEWEHNPTGLDETNRVISSRPFPIVSAGVNLSSLSKLANKLARECHHVRANYVYNTYDNKNVE